MGIVVGLFSAKGGVGKSLLSVNLAASLAAGTSQPTLVVDFNPGLGHLDLLLDLKSERSWADLVPVLDEIEPQHLKLAVTGHASGLDLLACPISIRYENNLKNSEIEKLIAALRKVYTFSFVDSETGRGGMTRALFRCVDVRLIVLTPDLLAIRATRCWLEGNHADQDSIGLVLNQYSRAGTIKARELSEYLGCPLFGVLPIDPASVWRNVSFGEICALKKRGKLGKALRGLSSVLLSQVDSAVQKETDRT